jgi:hypothetical protein
LFVGLTWRNTGEGVWSTLCLDHALAVTFDDCGMAGGDAPVRIPMLGDAATPPGQSYQFIARLEAPGEPGQCTVRLRMSRGQGADPGLGTESGQAEGTPPSLFGPEQEIVVQIVIPPNAATDWAAYQ